MKSLRAAAPLHLRSVFWKHLTQSNTTILICTVACRTLTKRLWGHVGWGGTHQKLSDLLLSVLVPLMNVCKECSHFSRKSTETLKNCATQFWYYTITSLSHHATCFISTPNLRIYLFSLLKDNKNVLNIAGDIPIGCLSPLDWCGWLWLVLYSLSHCTLRAVMSGGNGGSGGGGGVRGGGDARGAAP